MAAFVLNSTGKQIVAQRLNGTNTAPIYIVWGTSGTTATAADTALGAIAAPTTTTAVTGLGTVVTTTNTNDTFQVTGTVTAGGSLTVAEVGLINQATVSGAQYFLRADHGSTALVSGDSIAYTIKVQFT